MRGSCLQKIKLLEGLVVTLKLQYTCFFSPILHNRNKYWRWLSKGKPQTSRLYRKPFFNHIILCVNWCKLSSLKENLISRCFSCAQLVWTGNRIWPSMVLVQSDRSLFGHSAIMDASLFGVTCNLYLDDSLH